MTKAQAFELVEFGMASWLIIDYKKDEEGRTVPVTSWNLVWGDYVPEEPTTYSTAYNPRKKKFSILEYTDRLLDGEASYEGEICTYEQAKITIDEYEQTTRESAQEYWREDFVPDPFDIEPFGTIPTKPLIPVWVDDRSKGVQHNEKLRLMAREAGYDADSFKATIRGLPEGSLAHKRAAIKAAEPWLQDADFKVQFECFYGGSRFQPDVAIRRIDGVAFRTPRNNIVDSLYLEIGSFESDRIERNFDAIRGDNAVIALVTKKGKIIQELTP